MASKKSAAKKPAKKAAKKPINPIPRGYGTVTASMNQTDAAATIAFCKKAFGAKVLGPVHIGAHAMVAANSLVITDVPEGAIVMGVPARVIPARAATVKNLERPAG